MVIKDAIVRVFNDEGKPLSSNFICDKIIENDYYSFNSENAHHIVLTTIRRSCVGLDFPSSKKTKYFQILPDGRYWLKGKSFIGEKNTSRPNKEILSRSQLKKAHAIHVKEFKESILEQLKSIDPFEFEVFSRNLLKSYGFKKLNVTKKRKDGGIDGNGELKLGISFLNVAFECKRWNNKTVGVKEINAFRGAMRGDYAQGIFITTSKFSKDAVNASTPPGAIPIALIDGKTMVDIMIEKKFGVDLEELPIYINMLPDVIESLGD